MAGSPARGLLNGTERDQLIILMEQTTKLVQVVEKHESRFEAMKDGPIASLTTDNAISKNRLDRIEKILYGVVLAVLVQAVNVVAGLIGQ